MLRPALVQAPILAGSTLASKQRAPCLIESENEASAARGVKPRLPGPLLKSYRLVGSAPQSYRLVCCGCWAAGGMAAGAWRVFLADPNRNRPQDTESQILFRFFSCVCGMKLAFPVCGPFRAYHGLCCHINSGAYASFYGEQRYAAQQTISALGPVRRGILPHGMVLLSTGGAVPLRG